MSSPFARETAQNRLKSAKDLVVKACLQDRYKDGTFSHLANHLDRDVEKASARTVSVREHKRQREKILGAGRSSKSGNHPGTDGAFDQNYIGTLEQVFEEDNNQRARQASSSSSMSDVERDGVDAEAVVDEGDDGEWETVGKGGKPLKKIEIKSAGVELRGFWVDSPGFELVSRLAFA
ncbi:hypothetical protein MMC28_006584 [Mycoblastus sanguinarius]|nr:hypothetical protein [Mycoblastus sanguinarius]